MCGRYSLEFDDDFFSRYKTANRIAFRPRYNIAPQAIMPVIVAHSPNTVELMAWGLIPFWEKSDKPKGLNNLRDDTVLGKPWAKRYIQEQRCLVPSTGFFEWKKTEEGSLPYRIYLKDAKYFSFAGLYSIHKHPVSGETVKTYAILTTSPNSLMESIHHRMPVILAQEDEDRWLNPDTVEIEQLKDFLKPYPDSDMHAYRIPALLNSPRNDDKRILEPLADTSSMF